MIASKARITNSMLAARASVLTRFASRISCVTMAKNKLVSPSANFGVWAEGSELKHEGK